MIMTAYKTKQHKQSQPVIRGDGRTIAVQKIGENNYSISAIGRQGGGAPKSTYQYDGPWAIYDLSDSDGPKIGLLVSDMYLISHPQKTIIGSTHEPDTTSATNHKHEMQDGHDDPPTAAAPNASQFVMPGTYVQSYYHQRAVMSNNTASKNDNIDYTDWTLEEIDDKDYLTIRPTHNHIYVYLAPDANSKYFIDGSAVPAPSKFASLKCDSMHYNYNYEIARISYTANAPYTIRKITQVWYGPINIGPIYKHYPVS